MNLNPTDLLIKLLVKCGVLTYKEQVEFAAHLGWSIVISFLGYLVSPLFIAGWVVWHLYDEFIIDGFKGTDTYWDLGSKLALPILTGAYIWLLK